MTIEALITAGVGAALSIVGSFLAVQRANHLQELKQAEWRGSINTKVDAMWRIIFRKATIEGLDTGVLDIRSPITANLSAFSEHPDLVQKLRNFYQEKGHKLTDLDLLVQIETTFSDELSRFEMAHQLRAGGSIAAACYLLRPGMPLFNEEHAKQWKKMAEEKKLQENGL